MSKKNNFLVKQQNLLKKQFGLDCITKYKILNNKKILAYNRYKKLMVADYHIIGTHNLKSCVWRWSWSNANIPCNLTTMAKKSLKFSNSKFTNGKVKLSKKSDAMLFLKKIAKQDDKVKGYIIFKKPKTSLLIYMLIKSPKQPRTYFNKIKSKKIKKSKLKSC